MSEAQTPNQNQDFYGPGPKNNGQNNNNKKTITAIELAEKVIEATSTLIPAVSELDGDTETKRMIVEALQKLQRLAIDYTIAAAKRSQNMRRNNNYWRRRGRTWRR